MLTAMRRRFSALTPYGQQMALQAMHAMRVRARTRFVTPTSYKVPPGYRVVTDAVEARQVLERSLPARADAAASRRAVIGALLALMLYDDNGRIIGGYGLIAEKAVGRRLSQSAIGNHIRALVRAGVLLVVQRGSSAAMNGLGRNIAPTYVVLAAEEQLSPADQQALDRLKAQLTGRNCDLPEGYLENRIVDDDQGRNGRGKLQTISVRREHPERFRPRNRRERADAVAWLAGRLNFDLRAYATDLHRASISFFRAGYTAEAIVYAATHDRDGRPDPDLNCTDGRSRTALLNWRLTRWRTDRVPVDPPVRADTPRRGPRANSAARTTQPSRVGPIWTATKARSAEVLDQLAALRAALPTGRRDAFTRRAHLDRTAGRPATARAAQSVP